MVFFTCDKCGEALKKNQVEKHNYRCKFPTYSCIDCNKVFTSTSYNDHVKCISEDQKYGGKGYVAKENKGEVKQNHWIEQVERAINVVRDPNLKKLLQQIRGFSNIPRKEAKFINFLQNSTHIRNRNLCLQAWNCINEEAKKIMQEEAAAKGTAASTLTDGKVDSSDEKKTKINGNAAAVSTTNANDDVTNNSEEKDANDAKSSEAARTKFKWRKTIKRTLKDANDGQMPVKKLRKAVLALFKEASSGTSAEVDKEQLKQVFAQKLIDSGVIVEDKIARLPTA